jgi:hypothetical protein
MLTTTCLSCLRYSRCTSRRQAKRAERAPPMRSTSPTPGDPSPASAASGQVRAWRVLPRLVPPQPPFIDPRPGAGREPCAASASRHYGRATRMNCTRPPRAQRELLRRDRRPGGGHAHREARAPALPRICSSLSRAADRTTSASSTREWAYHVPCASISARRSIPPARAGRSSATRDEVSSASCHACPASTTRRRSCRPRAASSTEGADRACSTRGRPRHREPASRERSSHTRCQSSRMSSAGRREVRSRGVLTGSITPRPCRTAARGTKAR